MNARPKPKVVWVATLDGAHARFFALDRAGDDLRLFMTGTLEGTRAPSRDLVSDRPGRSKESVGSMRHSTDPPTDPQDHAEETFTATVARELIALGNKRAFQELIIVATPKRLGDLRDKIDSRFWDTFVIMEIPGDWTNMSAGEVAEHLQLHFDRAGRMMPYAKPGTGRPART
jgi:protein required for attachment to host cells